MITPKQSILILSLITSLALLGCSGSDDSSSSSVSQSPEGSGETSPTDAGALRVNEIVASAVDGGDDWIELYAQDDIADISVFSIVDDNVSHERQFLPEMSMSAGEFLVVYAIDEGDTPPTDVVYVTFKLGGDDAVYLFANEQQVDFLDWEEGEAQEGFSFGRVSEGSDNTATLQPTPGASNEQVSEDTLVYDTVINNDAQLRINEVVTKDIDGGADWIEFYAAGNESLVLSDYAVADENSEVFALPEISLAPGQYYRVFASTDVLDGEESVAFKLGSSDEVRLYKGTDLIDKLSWDKGDALINYSYGRYPDGSDAVKSLIPTPLETNIGATHGPLVINEVVASHVDDAPDWFELYNHSSAQVLLSDYQIIDSSDDIEPVTLPDVYLYAGEHIRIYATDEDLADYAVPFKLGKNDELSLIKDDETVDFIEWQASDAPPGYSYGLITDGAWTKDTLMVSESKPNQAVEIYVNDNVESIHFEIDLEQWQDLLDNAIDEQYHTASVSYKGVTLDEVAIRTKGNSSLVSVVNSASERYSFNIDVNEYVDGQKLLGMKKFVLNNMFNDPSYMREYIAYQLLEEMGVASPQRSFVNVYVNDELKGLYLLVEFVNKDFIRHHFANAEGDLYKPDGVGSDLQYISDSYASYSGVELKTNEDITDNGAFIDFVTEMAFGNPMSVIDSDSVLRYLAVSVALSNLDSYHGALAHNYYIYEQDNVFSMLPWDLNEAFGSFSRGCERNDIRELYIDEPTDGPLSEKPLIAKVLGDSEQVAIYHSYLEQLIYGPLQSDNFAQRVANIDALISEHVNNDPTAFYSFSDYQTNQHTTVERYYGLTDFIDYRVDNMTKQLNGEIPSSGGGFGFCN